MFYRDSYCSRSATAPSVLATTSVKVVASLAIIAEAVFAPSYSSTACSGSYSDYFRLATKAVLASAKPSGVGPSAGADPSGVGPSAGVSPFVTASFASAVIFIAASTFIMAPSSIVIDSSSKGSLDQSTMAVRTVWLATVRMDFDTKAEPVEQIAIVALVMAALVVVFMHPKSAAAAARSDSGCLTFSSFKNNVKEN